MRSALALLFVLAVSGVLRLLWIDAGWFGADQARDLTWAELIAQGQETPLVGPPMRNRVHLSAFYYYFWAIPFYVAATPVAAYLFAAVQGVVTTGLVFLLGTRIADYRTGLAAALVFATMPLAVIDGRIAWAPAALPLLTAATLLALSEFLERKTLLPALFAAVFSCLAVQLHLAGAVLVLLTAIAVLSAAGRLGARGIFLTAVAGLVVLLPTLWAFTVPVSPAVDGPGPESTAAGRWQDLLFVAERALSGLSPSSDLLPRGVAVWMHFESIWIGLVLLCAAVAGWLASSFLRPASVLLSVGLLAVTFLAVGLLPWEAWYYYLDVAFVPAALVVGLVLIRVLGRAGWFLLVPLAVARAVLLLWWVHAAHADGFVAVQTDLLRLGGSAPTNTSARARVPTLATRTEVFETLVGDLGLFPPSIWSRVHGPGLSDLDTANGYFAQRAFSTLASGKNAPAEAREVILAYPGQVPRAWRSAMPEPFRVGPFEALVYEPWLDIAAGRLLGCGGGPVPMRPAPTPLDYGTGSLPRTRWPCARPEIEIPVESPAGAVVARLRVFARIDGPGRVSEIEVVPGSHGSELSGVTAGLGRAVEVRRLPARIRLRLELDGPASLDFFELRELPPVPTMDRG